MEYLTDENYITGATIGISKQTLYKRVYEMGWSVEKAITKPINKFNDIWERNRETAEKNGVSKKLFYNRIYAGVSETEATGPKKDPNEKRTAQAKLKKQHLETASKNGINANTVMKRVYDYHWPVEKAVTEPVDVRMRKKA